MINRLLNRLHRVFNKDPQQYAVMSVVSSAGGTLDVDAQKLVVAHQYGSNTIYLGSKTIGQIAIELNALQYITASVLDPVLTAYLAKSLLPAISQDMASGAKLYASGSIFYNEMQVYAGQLQEQADNLADAEKQLYFHSATDTWLDYWGKEYLGVVRDNEGFVNDNTYRRQIIATILNPTQNNKVMERALKIALGAIDCAVVDANAEAGFLLKYDGSELYTGSSLYSYKYGSQPGCFYITTDLPIDDPYPLEYITRTLISTANKIKAAGTKLDGVRYKTSTSDTITITEHIEISATDGQADVLPWGLRYDGSVQHNSGRVLVYDGADSYAGEAAFNGAVAGAVTYSTTWDVAQSTGHTVATDQQQAVIQYNGLASYDGMFDQGATPPPVYDARMVVTTRRHNLFNGSRRYGSDKQHDGTLLYAGSADFSQMTYAGVHVIQEVTL